MEEINKTLEAFNKENFVRDLKVVEENEEMLGQNEDQNQEIDEN